MVPAAGGEAAPPLVRSKGVPRAVSAKLDLSHFDKRDDVEESFFSYTKMRPTPGLSVAIGVHTAKMPTCLNKKRTSEPGGNHTHPLA